MNDSQYYVHESSYIDKDVIIGKGTKIWHFSHIQSGLDIGSNCSLGQNVNVGNHVKIGNSVKIQNNVSIYEGVELEDFVFSGPSMVFTNIKNPRCEFPQRGSKYYEKTLVKKSVSIGANATVVCGNTIGEYAFIAAGSTVVQDVPPHALIAGVPGKIIGWVNKQGTRIQFDESGLSDCKNYKLNQGKLENC